MAKCIGCGAGFAQSRLKDGGWLCGKCVKQLGGIGAWMITIRSMRSEDVVMQLNGTDAVKTKILDHSSGDLVGSGGGVGRAVVGGALFGATGAIVGATTRKKKYSQTQYTMFKVWYPDGHTEIEQVEHGTAKYKKYLELIED